MTYELGQLYPVTAVKLVRAGVIVQVGDDSADTELIHISNLSKHFVKEVSDVVQIGKQYEAQAVQSKQGNIQLSLLNMGLIPSNLINDIVKPALSLDDMIKKANKDYEDKKQTINRRNKKRKT